MHTNTEHRLANSHVIGKSENHTLPKKHKTSFYEWNGAFCTFRQIRVMSFRYPRWNPCTPSLHDMSPFGKYRHQLFTILFHESLWFHFFACALKNVLSRRFSPFWARVGRVTGTKQLFCNGHTITVSAKVTISQQFNFAILDLPRN